MTRFVTSLALGNAPHSVLVFFQVSILVAAAFATAAATFAGEATARSIFLNGVDISNARNQSLEGVDIRIDAEGNVFIIGNHYEIYQQQPVAPLVPHVESPGTPQRSGSTPKLPPSLQGAAPGATITNPAGRAPRFPKGSAQAAETKTPRAKAPIARGDQSSQSAKEAAPEGKRPL